MFTRVLVPLDGSQLSEQSLDLAVEMAKRFDARVTLLFAFEGLDHLAQVLGGKGGDVDRATWEQIHRSTEAGLAAARAYLESESNRFTEQGVTVETTVVDARNSSPASAILEEAGRQPDTVIVMSTHGRGGLGRVLYGSTARKVLEASPNPVLLVRATKRIGGGTA
jgi:nucleotide-binding universal stress UspA family protein